MFTFNLKQAFCSIRHSILVIIIFSLGLSMVSGFQNYTIAAQEYNFYNSFYYMDDFLLSYQNPTLHFSDHYLKSQIELDSILENSPLPIEESHPFGRFNIDQNGYLYSTQGSNFKGSFDDGNALPENQKRFPISFYFLGEDFYESTRFKKIINIVEGKYPQNPNEVMIPVEMAKSYDFGVNKTIDLTMRLGLSANNYYSDYSSVQDKFEDIVFTNYSVAGIYVASNNYFSLTGNRYYPRYNYADYLSPDVSIASQLSNDILIDLPCFWTYNFTDFTKSYPIIDYLNELYTNETLRAKFIPNGIDVPFSTGLSLLYPKSLVKFNRLQAEISEINLKVTQLRRELPEDILLKSYIEESLLNTDYAGYTIQEISAIMIIPILIFCLLLGANSLNIGRQDRIQEFLLLLSKGVSKKSIQKQNLIEILMIGMISSTLALLGGLVIFPILNKVITPYAFDLDVSASISPQIGIPSIFLTFGLGILISLLSNYKSAKFFKNMALTDLLTENGSEDFSGIYDESTLFTAKQDKKSKFKWFKRKTNKFKSSKAFSPFKKWLKYGKKTKISQSAPQLDPSDDQIYENDIEEIEKLTFKWSYLFIIVGFFPILFFFLVQISLIDGISDNFMYFIARLNQRYYLVNISVICPLSLIYGIFRLISKEKPSILARVAKKIAHPFIREFDYLIGLNFIKRKDLSRILTLFAIFITLFVGVNIGTHSYIHYGKIHENFIIGADMKVQFNSEAKLNFNQTQWNSWSQELQEFTDTKGNPVVNHGMPILFQEKNTEVYENNEKSMMLFDFEDYQTIIQEGNKILPNHKLMKQIESINEYNSNPDKSNIGILVTPGFLTGEWMIDDEIRVTYRYYKDMNGTPNFVSLNCKILGSVERLPGVFPDYNLAPDIFSKLIFIDSSEIDQISTYNHKAEQLTFLFDLNLNSKGELPAEITQKLLENRTATTFPIFDQNSKIQFYNQKWNDISVFSINSEPLIEIAYMASLIVSIFFGITLGLFLIAIQKNNIPYDALFKSKGIGNRKLTKIKLTQILTIFILAIVPAILTAFFSTYIMLKLIQNTETWSSLGYYTWSSAYTRHELNLPIYPNILEIGSIILITFSMTLVIWFIGFSRITKKTLAKHFEKK
ncbi:hypothetical protein NEF87_003118 [Candidatus Lokiarchaeum ossiferum]|uniref:ABC3 transporter permease C-terminal domain-containing protein n=1 Tax=Candidatus Lokiarchaeum ossiferum TaxID=2951803 RepID=A0ABY6HU16_9ARCH|nr:hypothetical protein NEF87_003118 [Candidatus Lokiarchaeum sp. B-35]